MAERSGPVAAVGGLSVEHWKNRAVLVTGAGGFIGGNLAKKLVELGAEVFVLIRDAHPNVAIRVLGIEHRVTVIRGDLGDQALLERTLNEHGIRHVFHLAAQALVGVANQSPVSTFESNIRGTWILLEACRRVGVDSCVVASSDKAYGIHEKLPYEESAPLLGIYPYDASKACTDIIARSYAQTYQMPVTVTRNANIYGPGDMNYSRIVPDAIRCALEKRPLQIRSDGKMQRDYMFVDDAVDGYLRLAERSRELRGRAFNFGTQIATSTLEVVETVRKIVPEAPAPEILGTARYEIPVQYLDATVARRDLGWAPRVALLEGVSRTVEWYRRHRSESPRA